MCMYIFCSNRVPPKPPSRKVEISAPLDFTHIQHFGPHQQINISEMPVSLA